MAHFAKLGKGSKVVAVHVVNNDIATTEQAGVDFLNTLHGTKDVWKQTSYNTRGGIHILDGTPFRKNYAAKGFKYDHIKDAFIPPQSSFKSWILNENTCLWEAPVPVPEDAEGEGEGKHYRWNEEILNWDLIT